MYCLYTKDVTVQGRGVMGSWGRVYDGNALRAQRPIDIVAVCRYVTVTFFTFSIKAKTNIRHTSDVEHSANCNFFDESPKVEADAGSTSSLCGLRP